MSIASTLNNLSLTATNSAMIHGVGSVLNTLQSKLANGGRDRNLKFYYNEGAGGSLLQVAVKGVVGGAVRELKDLADNEFKSLFNKKKEAALNGTQWCEATRKKQEEERNLYGRMEIDGNTLLALDDWGCICTDALMLAVQVDHPVTYTQNFPDYAGRTVFVDEKTRKTKSVNAPNITREVTMNAVVWYDTTAMLNLSSKKNIIVTKVTGRDSSRKELVSNGDIEFSVSGQMTSRMPDVYPTEEVQKFLKVMQYKGVVKVNNQFLDQLGITHIMITDFNLPTKEGYKSVQSYSFSAIGLQPARESEIVADTLIIGKPTDTDIQPSEETQEKSDWLKMLGNQVDGLKNISVDLFTQGTALTSGMLENVL